MADQANTGIYEIVNLVNGKRYIGSSCDMPLRWRKHRNYLRVGKHHSLALQRAWDKYGEPAFVFRALLRCDRASLVATERLEIFRCAPEYNVGPVAPTQRGYKHSAETLAKMSAAAKGNQHTLGIKHSAETRRNMSLAHIGHKASPETLAKMSAAASGKKHSEATKAKMSRSHTGQKLSEQHKLSLSIARKADRARRKLRAAAPAI